jgi:hypothetical protein
MIGVDFECRDGSVRSLATPISALPMLMAGFAWAGAEAAEKRAFTIDPALRERLQDGARVATAWRVDADPSDGAILLDLEFGAAVVCARLSPEAGRALLRALAEVTGL